MATLLFGHFLILKNFLEERHILDYIPDVLKQLAPQRG